MIKDGTSEYISELDQENNPQEIWELKWDTEKVAEIWKFAKERVQNGRD